jgi:hypothetical protein
MTVTEHPVTADEPPVMDFHGGRKTMVAMKKWTVDIYIDEDDAGRTYAEARLQTGAPTRLTGVGRAKLNPADDDIPEIGDELATARALTDLGHRLLVTAAKDIEAVTDERVRLDT